MEETQATIRVPQNSLPPARCLPQVPHPHTRLSGEGGLLDLQAGSGGARTGLTHGCEGGRRKKVVVEEAPGPGPGGGGVTQVAVAEVVAGPVGPGHLGGRGDILPPSPATPPHDLEVGVLPLVESPANEAGQNADLVLRLVLQVALRLL